MLVHIHLAVQLFRKIYSWHDHIQFVGRGNTNIKQKIYDVDLLRSLYLFCAENLEMNLLGTKPAHTNHKLTSTISSGMIIFGGARTARLHQMVNMKTHAKHFVCRKQTKKEKKFSVKKESNDLHAATEKSKLVFVLIFSSVSFSIVFFFLSSLLFSSKSSACLWY